jgi:hypothetical protein
MTSSISRPIGKLIVRVFMHATTKCMERENEREKDVDVHLIMWINRTHV